jgi:hypothetical protein
MAPMQGMLANHPKMVVPRRNANNERHPLVVSKMNCLVCLMHIAYFIPVVCQVLHSHCMTLTHLALVMLSSLTEAVAPAQWIHRDTVRQIRQTLPTLRYQLRQHCKRCLRWDLHRTPCVVPQMALAHPIAMVSISIYFPEAI